MAAVLSLASISPARAEPPAVVVDTRVTGSLVAMAGEGLVEPFVLLGTGADAHDWQMRPSEARALARAGIVVWTAPELTPWLQRALGSGDATRVLTLLDVPQTRLRHYGDGTGGRDPHAWLDPDNAVLWLAAIARELAEADPANAATYRANAARWAIRVTQADTALVRRLAPAAGRGLVTAHDAYGYFADHYGLAVIGAIAAGDASGPGPRHIAALADAVRSAGAVCAFPDAGAAPATVESFATDTGLRLGPPLDALGFALPDQAGAGLYTNLLTGLADAMLACLSP